MRRIALIGTFFLLCSTPAFAMNNFYIDSLSGYMNMNDMGRHVGGGIGFGYNLIDNFNLIHRQMYSKGDDKAGLPHLNMAFSFGVEYTWFFWNRLGLRGGVMGGVTRLENTAPGGLSDVGFNVMMFTGIHVHIFQYLAVFLDAGFHYDYYSKTFNNFNIYGETVSLGVRFTIGKNKRISDDY